MAVYPNLFKPIKIGTMEVKNRLFLAPMVPPLASTWFTSPRIGWQPITLLGRLEERDLS